MAFFVPRRRTQRGRASWHVLVAVHLDSATDSLVECNRGRLFDDSELAVFKVASPPYFLLGLDLLDIVVMAVRSFA